MTRATWGHGRFVSYSQRGSDPDAAFESPSSELARQVWRALATETLEEELFGPGDTEQVLGMVLDRLMERLEPEQHDCLQLVVVSGLSMNEAARQLGWRLPSGWDRKRVSRRVDQGARQLREWLSSAEWIDALLRGRVTELSS